MCSHPASERKTYRNGVTRCMACHRRYSRLSILRKRHPEYVGLIQFARMVWRA